MSMRSKKSLECKAESIKEEERRLASLDDEKKSIRNVGKLKKL